MFRLLLILVAFLAKSVLIDAKIPSPPLDAPNNIIKLIIKSYVSDLLEKSQLNGPELKDKLVSMSDYIATHPALHQRHLWVGSTSPPADYNPDIHELHYESSGGHGQSSGGKNTTSRRLVLRKRSHPAGRPNKLMEQLPSEEICETKQKWEQINETHDLYENKVKVVQTDDLQQFVFTYRCAQSRGKCLGISALFESECTERFGWLYMYYQKGEDTPQWGYVNAPHHCACKLKPIYQPTIGPDTIM